MTASIPKGPTIHLAANVSVGVMFLSNLSVKLLDTQTPPQKKKKKKKK